MTRVLLLAPSSGLGGGIERYADTLEWAFATQGIPCQRADLWPGRRYSSRALAHARMVTKSRAQLARHNGAGTHIITVHRALLPLAALLATSHAGCRICVVYHGSDVWSRPHSPRTYLENLLLRRPDVQVVAVSSFTAGTLFDRCPAGILPPGLSASWFEMLAGASAAARPPGIELLTVFRLPDWRDKGLPQLLSAVTALERPDVRVTICGSGEPTAELLSLLRRHPYCTVRPGLTDAELAQQFAAADLFVLATRTRPGRRACGEGFGLVLLEAQLAGTAVVAPAYGGSHDAFVSGVTGVAPADESAEALAKALGELLADPARLAQMGKRAAEWARACFAPENYAARAAAALL